ncbi:hypothetical protein CWR48_17335 [Oceanobacillus arenosus]|uniref:Alginate lyase domain-containing protein n=1 Tax=Oceanobacillus arenosus TaxID=1229153 RepID=A0A3D8PK22_9BACI|nr:alginate lyase family protein [Oceanobacillus arenosus]RDW16404.1 hypothetical protein CWR48_17335 [Oceanobacillus arenosus]
MSFIFVSHDFVNKTRLNIKSTKGPWGVIYTELKQRADKAMLKGPWSVTYFPSKAASGDPHDYYYEAPYWWPNPHDPNGPYVRRDGLERPDRHKEHWLAFQELSNTVLLLCYAGYYLENKSYLQRAVDLLKVWFLDLKTRMNPHLKYAEAVPGKWTGKCTGIIVLRQLDRLVHALCFLHEYPDWQKELEGMAEWIEECLAWILNTQRGKKESKLGNNHSAWWVTHVAVYAAYLNKGNILQNAFNFYKDVVVSKQITLSGALPRELIRTKAFSYSLFNLDAQTLLCEIAYLKGTNLWKYKTTEGKGIESAIRFLLPYMDNPNSWPYKQIDGFIPDEQISLQYAAIRLGLNECLDINIRRRRKSNVIRFGDPLGPLALLPGYPIL